VAEQGAVPEAWFRIDDGSGFFPAGQSLPGIRVYGLLPTNAVTGSVVEMTGVLGSEIQSGSAVAALRMRSGERARLLRR
jgi:hypothetical protein